MLTSLYANFDSSMSSQILIFSLGTIGLGIEAAKIISVLGMYICKNETWVWALYFSKTALLGNIYGAMSLKSQIIKDGIVYLYLQYFERILEHRWKLAKNQVQLVQQLNWTFYHLSIGHLGRQIFTFAARAGYTPISKVEV